jgi:precorrin-2 dehydrogenase / sirohydrochlorin ferrochelatase
VNLFPIFLKLRRRRCLVVGAGKISEGKIAGLIEAGANVHVIAPTVTSQIERWSEKTKIRLKRRKFRPSDLKDVFLVVAATNSPEVHQEIYQESTRRKIICNIVDVPRLCDFYYPAVVKRGNLQIAISTSGSSPSLSRRLREEIERAFGPAYGEWLKCLARERKKVHRMALTVEKRKELLKKQASAKAFTRFLSNRAKKKPPQKDD